MPREPAQVYESRAKALDLNAPQLVIFPSLAGLNATTVEGTLFVNPGFLFRNAWRLRQAPHLKMRTKMNENE